jgi:hypothetical protein
MTPADVLAACPDELLRRRTGPNDQLQTANRLAVWLLNRGARPSLLEIEAERSRRANANV